MILLFVVNIPEFFLSHRLPVALAAQRAGFEVHVATSEGAAVEVIEHYGFSHHQLPLSRSGRNPLHELAAIWAMWQLVRKLKPHLMHVVTIKPVLYGGLVARLAGVPALVAAISGLGTVFVQGGNQPGWTKRMVQRLYGLALGHRNSQVIFQNPDDRDLLQNMGAVAANQTRLIRGSGVSLADYPVQPEPEGVPVVTMAARLLHDKGVEEFVDAARLLRARGVHAHFWLAGSPDPGNITSVSSAAVDEWQAEGAVTPLGHVADVAGLFAKSNVVVLPSYREGLPKVLIEAAACGRAVVTTDVPGCRDAITPDVTGLLVPVRDAQKLADAIQVLIENPVRRSAMAAQGRALAEREFTIEHVVNEHLAIYQDLLNARTEA